MNQSNTNLKNNVSLIKNGAPNGTAAARPINMAQGQSPIELPKQSNGLANLTQISRSQRSLINQQN